MSGGLKESAATGEAGDVIAKRLELIAPENFPMVEVGASLSRLTLNSLSDENIRLENGDVLVFAQKVVSKSEGRFVNLAEIEPGDKAKRLALSCDKDARLVQLILDESSDVLRCVPGVIIVRHKLGLVMANAGIDQSNVCSSLGEERVLLLPEDPDRSAQNLRRDIRQAIGVDVGVVVSDSFGRPWRLGTTGVCIGCAGIASIVDKRGDNDLYGRELVVTQIAVGDELATAASVLMGQAEEGRPVVIVRGLRLPGTPDSARHLLRAADEDLFS